MSRRDPVADVILAQVRVVRIVLYRARVDREAARDLEADVVCAAYEAALRDGLAWQEPEKVRTFLWVVAKRAVYRWHRERAHEPAEVHEGGYGIEQPAEGRAMAREVLALLRDSTTPERWRAVWAYACGDSVTEIAAREGISVSGVYWRMSDARQDLKAALARRRGK